MKSCGGCSACCESLQVPEVAPGNWQRCEHQCAAGCDDYENRPQSCRSFSCHWLTGVIEGDERRRPDKLGLVFTTTFHQGLAFLTAVEVWDGAAEQEPARSLLERLGRKAAIAVVRRATRDGVLRINERRVAIPLPLVRAG